MPESFASESLHLPTSSSDNPVAQRCYQVWRTCLQTKLEQGELNRSARRAAGEAFRISMPDLTEANLQDFLVCVAQGVLLGAIESPDAAKLLYAAQVMLSAHRNLPGTPKS